MNDDSPPRDAQPGSVFRQRDFMLFTGGVALSQIGTQASFTAMLFHVYVLSGSTLQVGLVGVSRGLAILVLSPLGGHLADHMDRRRLLQLSQYFSLAASFSLAVVSLAGHARTWHVLLAALLNSAAATFDRPTRKALVPALVGAGHLVKAFALINPTNQVGKLVGPALAGLILAVWEPGAVYLFDAVTFALLVVTLQMIHTGPVAPRPPSVAVWSSIGESAAFIRRRPLITHLMGLDLSTTLFTAYAVVLPAIALDILDIGPSAYGALAAAPAAGALFGGAVAYRLAGSAVPSGWIVLAATGGIGIAAIGLAHAGSFVSALLAVACIGLFDAVGTVIRQAAVLLETPDPLLGRVSALYSMTSSGGPALGELNVGWLVAMLGVASALTLGGLVPLAYAVAIGIRAPTVRTYRAARDTKSAVTA